MSGERAAQHKQTHINRQSHPGKTPLGKLELKCLNIGAPASHVGYTAEGQRRHAASSALTCLPEFSPAPLCPGIANVTLTPYCSIQAYSNEFGL